MRSVLLFLLVVILLSACDDGRVFEDYKDFESKAWNVKDTVSFAFQIEADGGYAVNCNIRNTLDYPYSRIFVNYTLEDSTHHRIASKLVSNYLFDVKTGEPNGDSGLGDIYDHSFAIENRELRRGKYFIKLEQFMRTDTLQGILAAGARVEKIESK